MQVRDAQFEVRSTYLGGFVGQLVSGFLWLLSCALTMWISYRAGIAFFVIGGFLIFPITQTVFRLMGHTASLSAKKSVSRTCHPSGFSGSPPTSTGGGRRFASN